jgi:hypothetical protein
MRRTRTEPAKPDSSAVKVSIVRSGGSNRFKPLAREEAPADAKTIEELPKE